MIKEIAICGTFLLAATTTLAQDKPATASREMQHTHHGGFMQEGMHHAVAKGVTLDAKVDAAAHTVLSAWAR